MRIPPLENLKLALKGRPRDNRRVKITDAGKREEFGSLVAVQAGDVVAACQASRPPEGDKKAVGIVAALLLGSGRLPPETVVRVECDDLYTVLDHVPPPAPVEVEPAAVG